MELKPQNLYEKLNKEFGNLNWWPKDTGYHKKNNSDPRFEIIIGAILTQNTAWNNVEKALDNLKKNNILDIKKTVKTDIKNLQDMIKPSGFFNQKAKRVKNLAIYLNKKYNGDLDVFFNRGVSEIRNELLSLDGIGPETADSIILYAGNLPVFVVDAYTKRLCKRLPLKVKLFYDDIQKYFQDNLKRFYKEDEIVQVYNNLHAQIVILAKNYCKKKPECTKCILNTICKKQI